MAARYVYTLIYCYYYYEMSYNQHASYYNKVNITSLSLCFSCFIRIKYLFIHYILLWEINERMRNLSLLFIVLCAPSSCLISNLVSTAERELSENSINAQTHVHSIFIFYITTYIIVVKRDTLNTCFERECRQLLLLIKLSIDGGLS